MSLTPSEEQLSVVDSCENYNILVNSVPGSGKTTTILSIIERYIETKSILVLTYNSRLRKETKAKLLSLFDVQIEMGAIADIHTYHSFCQSTWGVCCKTDQGIRTILDENMETTYFYDIVIVDESQDMAGLYYNIFKRIILPHTQIIMLGDEKQSIYQYNGADYRFLLLADKLNTITNREYKKLNLSTSYRLSKPIADFVNNCVINKQLIVPSPYKLVDYPKPVYIIDDFFHSVKSIGNNESRVIECSGILNIVNMIKDFLDNGYKPTDIFILAPSAKGARLTDNGNLQRKPYPTPPQCIAWSLLKAKIMYKNKLVKIFVPESDDSALDDDVIEGKIVFCTFHKAKGLERKIVFVCGFDESYEKFYNKSGIYGECSNPMYVAITRSAEHLILLHHYKKDYLSCTNIENIKDYTNFTVNKLLNAKSTNGNDIKKHLKPSDAVSHMPNEYIYNIKNMIDFRCLRKMQYEVFLLTKQRDIDNCEQISEITSFYITLLHSIFVTKIIIKLEIDPDHEHYIFIQSAKNFIDYAMLKYNRSDISNNRCELYNSTTIMNLLKYSTYYCGISSGYLHKFEQIKEFKWINSNDIIILLKRLDSVLSNNCTYEYPVILIPKNNTELITSYAEVTISGITDIIDNDKKIVWEIKCVSELKDEHFIQLAIYKYMHMKLDLYNGYQYRLFNIRTGEVWKIILTKEKAIEMIKYLIDKKYSPKSVDDDEKFINKFIM